MVSYILLRLCRMGWGLEIAGVEKKVFRTKKTRMRYTESVGDPE